MNAPILSGPFNGLKELALIGFSGYILHRDSLYGDRVHLQASQIINNRSSSNMSGSLALELWALPAPYTGGDFNGIALASDRIGTLQGQHSLHNWQYSQSVQLPTSGHWYLTLMLREWTGNGYFTRDFMNFPEPLLAYRDLTVRQA